jgi:hypothetical protein
MQRETRAFVLDVAMDGDASLATLLTAPYTFVDAGLAKVYGVAGTFAGPALAKVQLDPAQRAGLLTQPSLMALGSGALETSPVVRGKEIRVNFLCDQVAAPPDGVPPLPQDRTRSVRARFEQHTASPSCAGCHRVMDPIGWGFERYDPVGNYRTTDAAGPIDARGVLESLKDGSTRTFDGAVELSRLLAASPEVSACFAGKWLSYALGRAVVPGDARSLAQATQAFAQQRLNIRELLVALARTDSFTTRSPSAGEVLR